MTIRNLAATLAAAAITVVASPGPAAAQPETPNVGHTRHHHPRGEKHDHAPASPERFITNRDGAPLALPVEDDAFFFVVYGDRTGGPADGVAVLADAVRDTNLLEPDFVITVGDLVEGYNDTPQWLEQMREFKAVMDNLLCPWFPVAGNHDIYWRGDGPRPKGENEANYETHVGPLWYAFSHKNSWFIVLFSDEGNPETGDKSFNQPANQMMSDAQFAWLTDTLGKASGADHVFLFLHHPRWLRGGYGDDWEKVHQALVAAGNVTAVFAGHIHRMRSDPRDGIEYVALATTGGGQSHTVPAAGWLHHFNIVTVRKEQVALSAIPVGGVMDVREITGELAGEAAQLARLRPGLGEPLKIERDGSASGEVIATLTNPISRSIDVTLTADSPDSRWLLAPDHHHARLDPGDTSDFTIHASRHGEPLDATFRTPQLTLHIDLLADSARYSIPAIDIEIPLDVELVAPPRPDREMALDLTGGDAWLAVDPEAIDIAPDSPFTLECWFRARSYGRRTGLIAKTENSDYGFFVNDGRPTWYVLLGPGYVAIEPDIELETDRWYHIAGVYDGAESRLYLDGKLAGTAERAATRRPNNLPLMVGADVTSAGGPTSFFDGWIDAIHLSGAARYTGDRFTPRRRPEPDDHTRLLLNMDGPIGPWLFDESATPAHPALRGKAAISAVD
jgi:hypothetical protein